MISHIISIIRLTVEYIFIINYLFGDIIVTNIFINLVKFKKIQSYIYSGTEGLYITCQFGVCVVVCIGRETCTTRNMIFVVCPRHMAKPKKHSAKALPSVTLRKQHTAYTLTTKVYLLSVFCRALGKDVAEC